MVRKHRNRKSNAIKVKNHRPIEPLAAANKQAASPNSELNPPRNDRSRPNAPDSVFGWHDDITGPDAEKVHCFEPMRNGLMFLGYHYADPFLLGEATASRAM